MEKKFIGVYLLCFAISAISANLPPAFIKDMNLAVITENTPIDTSVYRLQGADPEGSAVYFGIEGSDRLGVNRQSGVVTVIAPIDREENETLNFYVTIEDIVGSGYNNNNNNVVKVFVSVIVLDENDNTPEFNGDPFKANIDEDTFPGSTVISAIQVTDKDQVGSSISVRCQDEPEFPGACDTFQFIEEEASSNKLIGSLILVGKLDYRKQSLYRFSVVASDGSLNSTATVEVHIGDVQNNPPVFTGSLTGIVQEDAPVGTLIMTLRAVDGDMGKPRDVMYSLENNPESYFKLDQKTGELRTATRINKEVESIPNGVASIKIKAIEIENNKPVDSPDAQSSSMISVTIKDVNDEAPKFNKNEFVVHVDENVPNGTPLPNMDMVISDSDVGSNSVFEVSLMDTSGIFSVEPPIATGSTSISIRIAKGPLDYENPNQRKFIVLVVAKESFTEKQLSSTSTVTVNIVDVNDNQPTFDRENYSASVMETAVPGTVVATITATDLDEGDYGQSGVVYSLFGNGAERFSVNPKTGVITVAPCPTPGRDNCLDFESRPTYYLSYQATDNNGDGQASLVPLTISLADANDNPPKFVQNTYSVIIDEGDTEFVPLLQVRAKDPDVTSNIQYSIVSGNAISLLTINPVTGIIRITDQLIGLDVSGLNTDLIILTVQANDGADGIDTATVKITVRDANNNIPVFETDSYAAEIIEGSAPGTVVEQVSASDADTGINSRITYRINKGAYDHFDVTPDTGIITISSAARLDYDKRKKYVIEVFAVDGGNPINTGTATVTVNILNSNDKAPYFTPSTQRAQISEGAEIGEIFHTLKAKDPDFDTEEATLRFSVDDKITAVDKDGHRINGETNEYRDYFAVNPDTGEVRVASKLNRDLVAIVSLTVTVTDISADPPQNGSGTMVINIVDVNDFAPVFSPPWTETNPEIIFNIVEEQPEGSVVYTFAATDSDSNIDAYLIQPENEHFKIDNTSGVLMIRKRIDYETIQQIKFNVIALDTGVPQLTSTAMVMANVVNINDKDPVFKQASYEATVMENSVKGTPITTVMATDDDLGDFGRIKYDLLGEYNETFSIDQTGMIKVKDGEKLDRESTRTITLQAVVTDQGDDLETRRSVSVPVYVTLEDENDNAPKFSEKQYQTSIVENIPTTPPSPILQVTAMDKDEGQNAKVMYKINRGNLDDIFYIHPSSGIISPVKSLQGKGIKQYRLTVEARDMYGSGPNFDETMVHINVLDINQAKPQFVFPSLANVTITIAENQTSPETLLMTVAAVDMDYGENGRISYFLKVGNRNVKSTDIFKIDTDTGDLKTQLVLDREIKERYELVLVARDHGSPTPFETLRFVTIMLDDVDDNFPQFTRTQSTDPYLFKIMENNRLGELIGQVKAHDKDVGINARIYYFVVGGNKAGKFVIDKVSGTIRANSSLDREAKSEYSLVIKATNNANYNTFERTAMIKTKDLDYRRSDSTLALVNVTVGDVNDNEPKFISSSHLAGVEHTEKIGHLVTTVKAVDPDATDVVGNIKYYVSNSYLFRPGDKISLGSVSPSPFNISSDGRLTISSLLTPFNQNRFEVTVVARETTPPYRETKTVVKIWVYEMNQLIRVILSQPPEDIVHLGDEIISVLSNATSGIVVIDDIQYHVTDRNTVNKKWTDMYIHVVGTKDDKIVAIPRVLEHLDKNFDFLRSHYDTFYIEHVLPAYLNEAEKKFDSNLVALIALLIVLFVGLITVLVTCSCVKYWYSSKIQRALVKNEEIAEVTSANMTENPLWLDQKLKLYEEQELSMQVFNDQEHAAAVAAAAAREGSITSLNTTDGASSFPFGTNDETGSAVYATLDKSAQRRSSLDNGSRESTIDRLKMKGITFPTANIKSGYDTTGSRGDGYASIGGRYTNLANSQQTPPSENNVYHELSASTSGHSKPLDYDNGTLRTNQKSDSNLSLNRDGEPELVASLM